MIKHIVLFKLSDNSPQNCARTADILRSMDGKVDLLRGITVGTDNLHSPRSYDIALEVLLDDMKLWKPTSMTNITAMWSKSTCIPSPAPASPLILTSID